MKFRPRTSLSSSLFLLAAFACVVVSHPAAFDVYAQEAAIDSNQNTKSAIQDKIELLEIRFAIRLQEVEIAKAERELLTPTADGAAQMREATEKQLAATENELSRLAELQEQGLISESKVQAAQQKRRAAQSKLAAYQSDFAARNGKLRLHDQRIKLLELRAELTETRLNQLKRRLQQ